MTTFHTDSRTVREPYQNRPRVGEDAGVGTQNLMPIFVERVEDSITLGEICSTLRGVWGEYVAEGF